MLFVLPAAYTVLSLHASQLDMTLDCQSPLLYKIRLTARVADCGLMSPCFDAAGP